MATDNLSTANPILKDMYARRKPRLVRPSGRTRKELISDLSDLLANRKRKPRAGAGFAGATGTSPKLKGIRRVYR